MELTLEKKVQNIVNQFVTQLDINGSEVQINLGTNPGDNWFGGCFAVSVSGYNEIKEAVRLSVYLKIAPLSMEYRIFSNVTKLYEREIYFYKKIIPEFMALQREKNVSKQFQPFPKYHLSSTEYLQEFVILGDMREKGYKTADHRQIVNYDSALVIMSALGKLHALSFGLKTNKPKVYEEIKSNMKENFFSHPLVSQFILEIDLSLCNQFLSICEPDDSSIKESVQKLTENLQTFMERIVLPEEAGKYDVICHGDPELRNIMFKFGVGSKSHTPEDCCLLDMQFARICSPALDLLYFLFLSTDKDFRRSHYKSVIEEYYNSFSTFLKELGGNPEEVFPLHVLQDHLKKFAPFGLYIGIWLIAINLKSVEEIYESKEDTIESLVKNFCTVSDKSYFIRVKDLILDMIDYDYDFSY